jgi:predicted AAA+ superfamily ATPase
MLSDKYLYTVHDFAKTFNLSEDALRKAIRFNKLASVRSGRGRYITVDDYKAYRASVRDNFLKGVVNGRQHHS